MSNTNFTVKINYVVFSTDIPNHKQFVLSLSDAQIEFPSLILNFELKRDLEKSIIEYIKQYIFVSELELIPQLIKLDASTIDPNSDSVLNIVYGFLVEHTTQINDCYWQEFNYTTSNKFSHILFETIQKLR